MVEPSNTRVVSSFLSRAPVSRDFFGVDAGWTLWEWREYLPVMIYGTVISCLNGLLHHEITKISVLVIVLLIPQAWRNLVLMILLFATKSGVMFPQEFVE